MKTTINFYEFRDTFHRIDRGNQFSYEALMVLFEYLEEYERDTGIEIEFDPIAICCEYSEMTELEIRDYYGLEDSDSSTQFLRDHTLVIGETPTSVIFANF